MTTLSSAKTLPVKTVLLTFIVVIALFACCFAYSMYYFSITSRTQIEQGVEGYRNSLPRMGVLNQQQEYLSVMHVSLPPEDAIPLCIGSELKAAVDNELDGHLTDMINKDYIFESGKEEGRPCVYGRTALDRTQNSRNDEVIMMATNKKEVFVIASLIRRPSLEGMDIAKELQNPQRRFICTSAAARRLLVYLAMSIRITEASLDIRMASIDFPVTSQDEVLCTVVSAISSARKRQFTPVTTQESTLRTSSQLQLYDYMKPDFRAVLAMYAPYIRTDGIFLRDVYPAFPSNKIHDFAVLDILLVVPRMLSQKSAVTLLARHLLNSKEALARTTYYAKYFDMAPGTMAAIKASSPVILIPAEHFVSSSSPMSQSQNIEHDSITIREINEPLPTTDYGVMYQGQVRVFIAPPHVKGVPLRVGDLLIILGQARSVENGEYRVCELDRNAALLCSPAVINEGQDVRSLMLLPGDIVFVATNIDDPNSWGREGVVTDTFDVSFDPDDLIVRRKRSQNNKINSPDEICMSNRTLLTKEACEREKNGIWDRPCANDIECPYFVPGKLFNHVRGGCMNSGYCEMPYGVEAISFRKGRGVPMCRGGGSEGGYDATSGGFSTICPLPSGRNQKLPDFAFLGDEFERPQ